MKKVVIIFILSLCWWIYLATYTQMSISCDAIDYQASGKMIADYGIVYYLQHGPKREPVYPLLIALAMKVNPNYTKVMAFFGVIILFYTQILMLFIMRRLKIRWSICAVILAYFAVSPGIVNSAFSLFSEIPAVLLVVLVVVCVPSVMLGAVFSVVALTKAVFECIFPAYLLILRPKIVPLIVSCVVFYAVILGYKELNHHYNGHFVITNRGDWALYGSTARRVEGKNLLAAISYIPGTHICEKLFSQSECDYWSYKKSDEFGHAVAKRTDLIKLSIKKALSNPLQYFVLTIVEGLKMFFWESTKIGFVTYPRWLQKIYDIRILNNGLRFIMALLTVYSFFFCLARKEMLPITALVALYIIFFSFFFVLDRYTIPIAPLYLIMMGYTAEKI